jgi:6-phosphogluconolactonase (cycloisomerase 2 family)
VDASSGRLRWKTNKPVFVGNAFSVIDCLSADPDQKFVYESHLVNSSVPGDPLGEIIPFSLDAATGTLSSAGGVLSQNVPLGCLTFAPNGKFAYAAASLNNTNNQLATYSVNTNSGAMTLINTIALNSAPSPVAMDPLGQYLYVVTPYLGGSAAQAYGFSIDATTGALTAIPGTPFQLTYNTGTVSFDPSGKFVYMANGGGSTIDVYSMDRATGKLTAVSGGTANTWINPSIVHFLRSGQFAYSTCSMDAAHTANSASLVSYSVGSDGKLTTIGNSPLPGIVPSILQVDPSAKFV